MNLLLRFYLIFFLQTYKEDKRDAIDPESENVALHVINSGRCQVLLMYLGVDN